MKHPGGQEPRSLSTLLGLIAEEEPGGFHLLDVGCGTGTLTFPAAAMARHVTGVDRDVGALDEARARAGRERVDNVTFLDGDVEAAPYETLLNGEVADMVVSHLCLSDAIVAHAAAALEAGRCLILAGFHTDHWCETGVVSRFAYEPERLREVVEQHGFGVEYLGVEQEVRHFGSEAEALRYFDSSPLQEKFRQSARWEKLEEFYSRGGRTFTRSICTAKARKR